MNDKLYDILNKIQRWLPALAIFYVTLSTIWNLPLGEEISKTILAITTLLAATLEIANSQYEKNKDKDCEHTIYGFVVPNHEDKEEE